MLSTLGGSFGVAVDNFFGGVIFVVVEEGSFVAVAKEEEGSLVVVALEDSFSVVAGAAEGSFVAAEDSFVVVKEDSFVVASLDIDRR